MHTVLRFSALLALTAALVALAPGDAAAQRKKKEQEPPPPPIIQVPAGMTTPGVEVVGIEARITSGRVTRGSNLICATEAIYPVSDIFHPQAPANAEAITEEIKAAGYTVHGNTGGMFDDSEKGKAAFRVGGTVTRVDAQFCITALIGSSTATVDIHWQVYDNLQRKVVYNMKTSATARLSDPTAFETIVPAAIRQATRNMLTDQKFYDAILGNASGPPAIAAEGLGSAASGPSSTLPPATKISRLPLSQKRFQDVVTDARGNVVTIFNAGGTGSGFYISDRYVVTNEHVVGGAQFVKVKLITGREILGEVVAKHQDRDVALIQTETSGLPGLPIRTDEPGIGTGVFVIGSPQGVAQEGSVAAGIVSSYRTGEEGLRWIQSDVSVIRGNSGGPMLDESGNIIGLTSWGKLDRQSGAPTALNFFVPITDALAKLNVQFR